MNRLKRYLLVLGLAILGATVIITYQQNMAKKTDQSIERFTRPLIDRAIYGIVVEKSVTDAADRIQSSNAMKYSLKIEYNDIKTKSNANFIMNFRYKNSIDLGDTVTKEIGERTLQFRKKKGNIISIPIE